ncbi:MaoC family dehydratase [Parahaliea maris]|uniref:MaoC family dehydratase n=1 Tax=Parahaliea maris TaxID=2716870 RepID=A0A5C8ZZ67_9GAMM|nr:MaoC family dehydratase [Parahaliea maris]TXS92687.1 MaoC family dehydratase [Parahaliea maris]
MTTRSNFTFDELTVGQSASYQRRIDMQQIRLFAAACGDVNPVHLDPAFAATTAFGEPIAHGMLTGAVVSAAIAMELPGPGTIYLGQSLRFRAPVKAGDTLTVELTVSEKRERRQWVSLDCTVRNQHDKVVASGTAEVMAPTEKTEISLPPEPQFTAD